MMKAEPQKEHAWLQRMVGEWTFEADCDMGPDQPRMRTTGRETMRALGDIWVVGEGEGTMPGTEETGRTMITLGYDPQKGHFVGTWVGSMMTLMWVYKGTLDESGRILTLEAEGPDFMNPGQTKLYHDIVEMKDDDYRTLTSRARNDDGTFQEFMVAHYRRVK